MRTQIRSKVAHISRQQVTLRRPWEVVVENIKTFSLFFVNNRTKLDSLDLCGEEALPFQPTHAASSVALNGGERGRQLWRI